MAVIGGGIVGCAASAFLAESGASVELFERAELAGAASGRNSGSVQHPFDPVLTELYSATLASYRRLGSEAVAFELPPAPAGVLLLAPEEESYGPGDTRLDAFSAEIERDLPELDPQLVEGEELRRMEPILAADIAACRIETGYPVRPAAATLAFAELARRHGAGLHEHVPARPWVEAGVARGVILQESDTRAAGAVLVAAGPWTPALVDPSGRWRPVSALWGVVADVALPQAPQHMLEHGVEKFTGADELLFSIVAVDGVNGLGSTFLPEEPDPADWIERLRANGQRFVPSLSAAHILGSRACARPLSFDGRPLIGAAPGVDGLWVACGNGPWGISTGPATARIAADALLGRATPPSALDAGRFDPGGLDLGG